MSELAVIWPLIVAHWPFFAYAFAFAFIGEVAKRHIFTPSNVAGMETEARKWWNRKGANRAVAVLILALARTPFEYHPAIAGLLLGLVPGIPLSAGVHYGVQSMVYCASSGVLSLSLYAIVHAVVKFGWTAILHRTEPVPEILLPGEEPAAPATPTTPTTPEA